MRITTHNSSIPLMSVNVTSCWLRIKLVLQILHMACFNNNDLALTIPFVKYIHITYIHVI